MSQRGFLIATALVVALLFVTAWLARIEPLTSMIALTSMALCVAGVLIVTAMMARKSIYPRWAWWSAGGIATLALVLSVVLAPSPAAWNDDVRVAAALMPWWFAFLGITRESGVRARCEKHGWVLIGSVTILSAVLCSTPIVDGWKALFA